MNEKETTNYGVVDKSGAHEVGAYTQADVDRARADGYNDGFRQGKQSRVLVVAQAAATEILDFLNFDCENEEVKQDISSAAYIISKHANSVDSEGEGVEDE